VDYCERSGIAFIPWFPLGAGRVAGRLLERIAKARRVKPIQIALAWLLKRSPIMLPIPGTSSVAHLEENVQAASLQVSEKEYLELTGITELLLEPSPLVVPGSSKTRDGARQMSLHRVLFEE
jgi:pyridoxine 4-dehydrogenase